MYNIAIMKKRRSRDWRLFEEAREYIHSLGFRTWADWRLWAKSDLRPADIPSNPQTVYLGKGWLGFGDWLGTDRVGRQKNFRPFLEARSFVRSLGLKNTHEWNAWAKSSARPQDIPFGACRTYQEVGWAGWGDWLGTGRITGGKYPRRPFQQAREFVRSLGLKNTSDWREWARSGLRPKDIPSYPWSVYKGQGWISMLDWLGTERADL